MAKYSLKIQSRPIYCEPSERQLVGELIDGIAHCKYDDDVEVTNDFDIILTSDSERFKTTIANDTAQTVQSSHKGTPISGTRTSPTIFTRNSGVWTVDELLGWRAYAYVATSPYAGTWLKVADNTTDTITVTGGSLPALCDTVALFPTPKIRHNFQIIPQAGFYGSYFKYTIEKKVPLDGNFKWLGMDLRATPLPGIDPEFLAGSGNIEHGWE